MKTASSAPNAVDHWWKNHFRLKMTLCFALSAILMSILPSAAPARRLSCQVKRFVSLSVLKNLSHKMLRITV